MSRSKLHGMLRDRAYVGEVKYRGQWYPGTHPPIVDRDTFERVQVLLGEKTYHTHESVFGGGMVQCGCCGRPVVAEVKQKPTRSGVREYRYYRCARYNQGDHPRVRVAEGALEGQILGLFGSMRIEDKKVRDWFIKVLRAKRKSREDDSRQEQGHARLELERIKRQKDRLLNLRLLDEIDAETFAGKKAELQIQQSRLQAKLEGKGRQKAAKAGLAEKAFELSQTLTDKWVTADTAKKRLLLEIVCLNFSLDDVSLVPIWRKPFDILAEGPFVQSSRGDWTRLEPLEWEVVDWPCHLECAVMGM